MGMLEGKIAIITGGASGQGKAAAERFVAEGAKVLLTDIQDKGYEVAASLGEAAAFTRLDVSDEGNWQSVVNEASQRFGDVTVLVNNAGLYNPQGFDDTTPDALTAHFEVNVLGSFLGMKAVVPAMRRAGGGAIINTASVAGLRNLPGNLAYAASKWAVRGLGGCAAGELAREGIRVNTVCPGVIDTPMLSHLPDDMRAVYASMTPIGRFGQADEVVQALVFLASDAASFIVGAELAVDGGGRL